MAEDKTFTQEEVNKLVGQARLEGKEIGRKEFEGWISPEKLVEETNGLNGQLGALNDQIKALTTEKENLQTQLNEKDGQIANYEINSVKLKIARETGLSYEAIEFLQGGDEEAIRKSAESLKSLVGAAKVPPLGNPETPPEEDGVTAAFYKLNPQLRKN